MFDQRSLFISQITRMAFNMYLLARFWNTLRLEDVDVHKGADGTIFSMDQYRCAGRFLQ